MDINVLLNASGGYIYNSSSVNKKKRFISKSLPLVINLFIYTVFNTDIKYFAAISFFEPFSISEVFPSDL